MASHYDDDLGAMRSHTFAVQGAGGFPLDMLRYDSCVPASETDSHELGRYSHEIRTVKLRRIYPKGGRPTPTEGRWKSFGWEVIDPVPR